MVPATVRVRELGLSVHDIPADMGRTVASMNLPGLHDSYKCTSCVCYQDTD